MLGASCTTGEIAVFCDSDCVYEPNWLRKMLMPFSQRPDIQVVSGETTTHIAGPYGLAMSLTYLFHDFLINMLCISRPAMTPTTWRSVVTFCSGIRFPPGFPLTAATTFFIIELWFTKVIGSGRTLKRSASIPYRMNSRIFFFGAFCSLAMKLFSCRRSLPLVAERVHETWSASNGVILPLVHGSLSAS